VREAVDFLEVVNSRTELRRAGVNRYVGLCPFHDERSPSFGIDPVEKLYHCFGCGAGGDVFKFVMETENVPFGEALELLADRYGVELERETEDPGAAQRRGRRDRLLALLERTAAWYVRMLWESAEAAPARAYLESRGLDEAGLREFRVGFAPDAWDRVLAGSTRAGFTVEEVVAAGLASRGREEGAGRVFDRFRGRLMFPLCDARGRVLGFGARALKDGQQPKYVNSSEGEVFSKGRMVFGTHLARGAAAKAGTVVLAEGYTDVIALHQAGLRNAVGLMGTSLTTAQAGELAKLAGTVVLCLDADAAGQEAMAKAAAALRSVNSNVKVAALPGGSDPADLLAAEGIDGMRRRVEEAAPLARWQVERALQTGDTDTTEGRDRALRAVADIIGGIPPSVLRDELVRLVAGHLVLSEGLVAEALKETRAPARVPARAHAAPSQRPDGPVGILDGDPGSDAPGFGGQALAALDRRQEAEYAFLALCLARPGDGQARLAEADLAEMFPAPLTRRAAEHIRDHAAEPSVHLPSDEPALGTLMAQLVMRARAAEAATTSDLDRSALYLDLSRLEREIAQARMTGDPLGDLAAERQRVLSELRRLTV
jgi:DNA primase